MNKEDAIYRNDIFDGIADDEPKGVWSVQVNSACMGAEIKCFMWPGYYAYHKEGLFGGVYIGNGIKNKDVGFMLWANINNDSFILLYYLWLRFNEALNN